MAQPAARNRVELPDPLDPSDDVAVGNGDADALISRLAGDAVERMLSSDSLEPIAPEMRSEATPASRLNPVQELTSQLDTFFDELRQRQEEAAAVVDAIPEANPLEINEQERVALDSLDENGEQPVESTEPPAPPPPRDLIAQYESKKSTPWLLRPLDRGGAVVEGMSPLVRGLVNISVVVSFLAACAALVYVLILRAA